MATKKSAKKTASAKTTANKKVVAKPAKSTKATKTTVTRVVSAKTATKKNKLDTKLPKNLINIIIAEIVGTFILTMVAVLGTAYFMLPFYVGLTLVVMVLTIGAISGSHINPAVTFGLWSMRKLQTVLVPFYWAAQLLGAMAAIVLLGSLSGGAFAIHFDHFMEFSWGVFALELVGTAVFLFGLAAAVTKTNLSSLSKATAIGMSLMLGLIVTGSILPYVQNSAVTEHQEKQAKVEQTEQKEPKEGERAYPREVYIGGATLNPAVAMAVTEKTDSQLQGSPTAQKDEKAFSRLGLEVILATLIGAALGGNLFLLVNYRSQEV